MSVAGTAVGKDAARTQPLAWQVMSGEEVAAELEVDVGRGLPGEEADQPAARYRPTGLRPARPSRDFARSSVSGTIRCRSCC